MRAGTFKILVGIDFSDSSAGVLEYAVKLAERSGATLQLAHITPTVGSLAVPLDVGLNMPTEFSDAQQVRERLERLRGEMGAKVPVDVHVRMGDPVRGLMECIRELQPNLVVVGSHGHGAVMRLLVGSVCQRLTRLSPVPVLVVPDPRRSALVAQDVELPAGPTLPSVGAGMSDTLSESRTNDASSGSVSISPGGTNGCNVNPELRVRY